MTFVLRFFLLVTVLGFVELFLLVRVAALMGFWQTLALCILTAVVGGSMVRLQGLETLGQISRGMAQGRLPTTEIVSGVVLLIVGALLIVPGFVTDAVGFLLLIPRLRRHAATRLARRFEQRVTVVSPEDPFGPSPPRVRAQVIDVDPGQ